MKILMLIAMFLPIIAGAALPLFRFKNRRHRELYVLAAVCVTSAIVLTLLLNAPVSAYYPET